MAQYPIRQSLQRTAAVAGVLALVLATAPVVPTLSADGDLTLSSGTAHAQGRGGGRGGRGGRGRGQNGHADFGENYDNGHAAPFGHTSARPGLGLGHEKARGYGHHHDANYDGGPHNNDGGHGGYSDRHNSDLSFSAATDNARRDFGRVRSGAKGAWSDFWN